MKEPREQHQLVAFIEKIIEQGSMTAIDQESINKMARSACPIGSAEAVCLLTKKIESGEVKVLS